MNMTDSRPIPILTLRGVPVIIDADLARLYGVPTRALNQAVRRNLDRFPDDFRFQLTLPEKTKVITDCDHLQSLKFSKALPHAFTEHGTLMAANVLNSTKRSPPIKPSSSGSRKSTKVCSFTIPPCATFTKKYSRCCNRLP